jgi:endonuclease/exonuclease/phosphatase family metal-dependent hydrolase
MSSARAGRLCRRSPLAVGAVLVATLSACVAADEGPPGGADPRITVMTQNVYLGAALNDVFAASSEPELVAAGSDSWARLLGNDFTTRAGALADEIARERPDVIGLQEVALWRDQTPGDVLTRPAPDATRVAVDFLAILEGELRARGVPYTPVATSTNVDVEFPRSDPGAGLVDVRLTDRDVIMVRNDVAEGSGNPREGRYAAQFSEPFPTGVPVASTRSWTSIDHRLDPTTTVRIVNTHLEVGQPGVDPVQQLQADELLGVIAASPHPVIALGDFNSAADGSTTPTYRSLTAVLHDAWASARPADPGWTCCQPQSLADAVGHQDARVDLVLTSGDWPVDRVARTVDRPFRVAPPPLWASDHVGVTARIVVPRQ